MPVSVPDRPDSAPAPRSEAQKATIAEAALAVIARVGSDGVTHRLVAAEAELPLAATTYSSASKEDMVRQDRRHRLLSRRGLRAVRPRVVTQLEQLTAALVAPG